MNILIVRACAIGDFVVNLPALRAIQESQPAARFTFVGVPAVLQLARDFVNVAAVYSIEDLPWRRLFYEPVDGLEFERAIVWMKDPTLAGNLRSSGIVDVIRADPFPWSGHAASHLLQTLQLVSPGLPDYWSGKSDCWILHPGSGSPAKCWPYFRELAERLEIASFLIGPAESRYDTSGFPRLENLSLPQVAQKLREARGFVGNDSGITHLAAYLGCPTVAIFGPTDPEIWGPIGRRVRVLHKTRLDEISVADVTSQTCSLIASGISGQEAG